MTFSVFCLLPSAFCKCTLKHTGCKTKLFASSLTFFSALARSFYFASTICC
jgi:hypothetical protein